MEDPLGSIFNSHHESADELRQKLSLTRFELETLRSENVELTNLLNMAQQERDEARNQLQKIMKALKMMKGPSCIDNNNLVSFAAIANNTKTNSSITESNSLSLSRVSSPVNAVSSSPEFSNMNVNNVVDSGCFFYEKPHLDPADAWIECLAKGKLLPQQGKLLDAVVDAGPLLRSLIQAGPLPTFRNPPPLQDIKVPPLAVKGFDSTGIIELGNSFATTTTTTTNTCSWNSPSSVLNFGGGGGSWNNMLPLTSNVSGVMNCAPSRVVRQRI